MSTNPTGPSPESAATGLADRELALHHEPCQCGIQSSEKVCDGGRAVNAVGLLATRVNGDGHRGVWGRRVATNETGATWNEFFADLQAPAWPGGASDLRCAHRAQGRRRGEPAGATWQHCRTHYAATRMGATPKPMCPRDPPPHRRRGHPPGRRSCVWSGRCWLSRPTNGLKASATSIWSPGQLPTHPAVLRRRRR
ncbi:hypothetical protein E7744_15165 (plasmid) [Citricoccus sp. SGAir0253]|uniref:transposase n=1 Tax=Citricoccus sp. SGAir0253 TaxID=2567881 RepID=UPI0010CCC7A6|nr:hypothetical protein E7744_15165 [Citricoccus sp. SGAir0253]